MSQPKDSSSPLSTPLSTTVVADPFGGLLGSTSGRATTTERRTTTTTTTKRTIKSSDDFMPLAADVQQIRSESRTGSISSTSSPSLFGANTPTAGQPHSLSSKPKNWSTSGTTTTTTTTTSNAAGEAALQSPVIQDTAEGGRVLKLRFDVTQYEPDEIVVKTVDNRLTVHAKHEERAENRSVYREYNREFHLPDGTDVEQIRSSLSKEGILTIDCPLPARALHGPARRIPIDRV